MMNKFAKVACLLTVLVSRAALSASGQDAGFSAVRANVDFSIKLQPWDGFGFNYVETAQTASYADDPQEYGGFSLLKEEDRQKIVDLVFGDDGLRVGVLKMFCDPFHQSKPQGVYDHETTTKWMRYFAREGLAKARAGGRGLSIITTLYGPPAYMTTQKVFRGRDLDPVHRRDLAKYLVDWVKFLRRRENLPVRYVSLHNEGEDWTRWNQAGLTESRAHDYNLFWPPEQVVDLIKIIEEELKDGGLGDVGISPGETSNWYRWSMWGYADAIAADSAAVQKLGLITSHGFFGGSFGRWFGDYNSVGIDRLRAIRPDLRAWVTSVSWGKMDAKNVMEYYGNIYSTKVNGIIPWAGIQRPPQWVGGDPNPGSAFTVHEDGNWEVRRGYYFYKQLTRAGQPGMAVARTCAMDSEIAVMAFASNGTNNPDTFVLVNCGKRKTVNIHVAGSAAQSFKAFGTTDDQKEQYSSVGEFPVQDGILRFESPGGSVTTFFSNRGRSRPGREASSRANVTDAARCGGGAVIKRRGPVLGSAGPRQRGELRIAAWHVHSPQ